MRRSAADRGYSEGLDLFEAWRRVDGSARIAVVLIYRMCRASTNSRLIKQTAGRNMSFLLLGLYLTCIISFDWARRRYFKRTNATPSLRRGLRPLGTVLSLMSLVLLVLYARNDSGVGNVGAVLIFLCSLGLFVASLRSHQKVPPSIAFTPGPPNNLTLDGAYKFIRHPIYSAYMLCWLGVVVAVPGPLSLGAAAIMFWLYIKAARSEEADIIASPLGVAYSQYKLSVGMFIPKISALLSCFTQRGG
jgi:protein-S-isoprenylcysteine O-methyltransferase Ste14